MLLVCTLAAWAQGQQAEIPRMQVEREGDALLLSANVKFDLPAAVEDALLKGVAVVFLAEAEVMRERWYWTNKRVAGAERHMRLAYQPLTRRWRLNVAPGQITNLGLGLALSQNFDNLADALAVVQRLSRWKIATMSELDPEQRHVVNFKFQLDVAQLPRPLQIGTVGDSDWNIAVSISQPLAAEVQK